MSYWPGPGTISVSESVDMSISAFYFHCASTKTEAITDLALLLAFFLSER